MKVRHLKRFAIPTYSRRRSTSWILKEYYRDYWKVTPSGVWKKMKAKKLPRLVLKALYYRNYWK